MAAIGLAGKFLRDYSLQKLSFLNNNPCNNADPFHDKLLNDAEFIEMAFFSWALLSILPLC